MSGRSAVFGQSRSAAFATSTKAVAVFFCVISCGAQRPSPAEGSTKDRLTPTGMCDMAGGNDAFLECNGTALEDTSALVDQERVDGPDAVVCAASSLQDVDANPPETNAVADGLEGKPRADAAKSADGGSARTSTCPPALTKQSVLSTPLSAPPCETEALVGIETIPLAGLFAGVEANCGASVSFSLFPSMASAWDVGVHSTLAPFAATASGAMALSVLTPQCPAVVRYGLNGNALWTSCPFGSKPAVFGGAAHLPGGIAGFAGPVDLVLAAQCLGSASTCNGSGVAPWSLLAFDSASGALLAEWPTGGQVAPSPGFAPGKWRSGYLAQRSSGQACIALTGNGPLTLVGQCINCGPDGVALVAKPATAVGCVDAGGKLAWARVLPDIAGVIGLAAGSGPLIFAEIGGSVVSLTPDGGVLWRTCGIGIALGGHTGTVATQCEFWAPSAGSPVVVRSSSGAPLRRYTAGGEVGWLEGSVTENGVARFLVPTEKKTNLYAITSGGMPLCKQVVAEGVFPLGAISGPGSDWFHVLTVGKGVTVGGAEVPGTESGPMNTGLLRVSQ